MHTHLNRLYSTLIVIGFVAHFSTAAALAADELVESYLKKKSELRSDYQSALIERIKSNPYRMELCLIKFDGHYNGDQTTDARDKYFYIATKDSSAMILKSINVEGSQKLQLQKEIIKVFKLKDPSGGAFCHDPVHGLRIIFDNKDFENIELSLSWGCRNIGFAYPDGEESLDTTPKLESLVTSLLPMSESEKKRFKNGTNWEPSKDAPEEENPFK